MENNTEVIDLTQSFTYCPAPINLSCSIIDLDDSTSIDAPPPPAQVPQPIVIEYDADVIPVENVRPRKTNKASKITKTKRKSRTCEVATSTVTERSWECPICWDRFGSKPLASTSCGHVFCIKCIERAVKIDKKCPTCRKPLKGPKAYHSIFL